MKTIKRPEEILDEYWSKGPSVKAAAIKAMKAYATQLELTDEEIVNKACDAHDNIHDKDIFLDAILWYRSQLKEMIK